jgi:hypothetical protein
MQGVYMSHHISLLKKNFKNLRKSPHVTSPFSIKNNSKNLRKSPHATLPFLLKNNSKKSRRTSYFSIENIILKTLSH